jgi:hypothetical protein
MRSAALQTLRELVIGSGAASRPGVSERMPVPFAFKPKLSAFEAFVEIFASLCRIILGCLLFAAWGVFALYLRGVWGNLVVFPLIPLFLAALALLMILISLIANRLLRL